MDFLSKTQNAPEEGARETKKSAPGSSYSETGGLRCGESYWNSGNLSWPFAHILVDAAGITISSGIGPFFAKELHFERTQILSIKKMGGVLSRGIRLVHTAAEHPPFVLFWTGQFEKLHTALKAFGYQAE